VGVKHGSAAVPTGNQGIELKHRPIVRAHHPLSDRFSQAHGEADRINGFSGLDRRFSQRKRFYFLKLSRKVKDRQVLVFSDPILWDIE
jgi:hypothetical protein